MAMALLQEAGHELQAFYLKIWLEEELTELSPSGCPWEEDLAYIEQSCELLKIPCQALPFQQEYQKRIVSYLIEELRKGHTPNPDLLCNHRIKFGAFLDYIEQREEHYEKVATGHYARIQRRGNTYELLTSADSAKDQSYFLAHLNQKQLGRAVFPLGDGGYSKKEVRSLAKKRSLPSAMRKDSQGLCFLGKLAFASFVERYMGRQRGALVEHETKKEIGEHDGYWFYTIGQRQGLGLSGGPWYVVSKDVQKNRVYISRSYHGRKRDRSHFFVYEPHWISGISEIVGKNRALRVKLRHGPHSYPCHIDAASGSGLRVQIEGQDQGIAPGQFAVFYEGERCLGCAVIQRSQYPSLCTSSLPANVHGSSLKSDACRPL